MKMIRNCRLCSVIIVFIAVVSTFLLAQSAFAGVTGTEGGTFITSTYTISTGGTVTLNNVKSSDCLIVGSGTVPTSATFTGEISGSYPTSADFPGMSIAQGTVALDSIAISPASGYTIDNLTVDGSSKGALSSFDFVGNGPFSFAVSFKQTVSEAPVTTVETPAPTTPDPKPTTKNEVTTPAPAEVAEVPVETPAVTTEPTVDPIITTTTAKTSKFPYWILFLILLFLIILLILFLLWRKRRKKKDDKKGSENK